MADVKTKDIAKANGFDSGLFDRFLDDNKAQFSAKIGVFSSTIAEEKAPAAVEAFKKYLAEEEEKKRKEQQAREEARRKEIEAQKAAERKVQDKKDALANMLVTSGFNFDGYTITRYSGYISGDAEVVVPCDDLRYKFTSKAYYESTVVSDVLVQIRIQALKELKEAAYDLGCNAVIGVDYDYITLEAVEHANGIAVKCPLICVTANGNAVVIEKK